MQKYKNSRYIYLNIDTFLFQNYNIGKTVFKAVYKNGDKTADIFT